MTYIENVLSVGQLLNARSIWGCIL